MSDDTIHCMGNNIEELRWRLVKAMLDEFPTSKERAKNYLKEELESNQ